jgi:hypothetical protein
MAYNVMFRSVDGAGYVNKPDRKPEEREVPQERERKEDAQKVADQNNDDCQKDGNPWGYRYFVQYSR